MSFKVCVYLQYHPCPLSAPLAKESSISHSAQLVFWARQFFVVGAALCNTGCLEASLVSIHCMPIVPPHPRSRFVTTQNVPRHCQILPEGQKYHPVENHSQTQTFFGQILSKYQAHMTTFGLLGPSSHSHLSIVNSALGLARASNVAYLTLPWRICVFLIHALPFLFSGHLEIP